MAIHEITAKTLLRKSGRVDSWFLSRHGMNLYRGCLHNCAYCDGRAEGYYVEGVFGEDIAVKVNAADLLRRELDPRRKRSPFRGGYVMLGGGVGDAYQPIESRYCLARKCLAVIAESGMPVHVLTKSHGVERDLDLLSQINKNRRAVVSMSFSTVDDTLAKLLEPGVDPPSRRLDALSRIKESGLYCGIYLMPVVPFITDAPAQIDAVVRSAKERGLDFVVCAGMTLKPGRQTDHFHAVLRRHFPDKVQEYEVIYRDDPWGNAGGDYYDSLNRVFRAAAEHHNVAARMPLRLFADLLDRGDLVVVLLEHIDYLLRLRGMSSPYGFAARSISRQGLNTEELRLCFDNIKGVGPAVKLVAVEILETGSSQLYESLMRHGKKPASSRFPILLGGDRNTIGEESGTSGHSPPIL